MNSCEKFDSLIEEYLDGALSDEENKQFLKHISSCQECRRSLEVAEKMHDMLAGLDYKLEVPSDFSVKLHEKIEQLPKRKSIYTYTRRIGAIAACVVLVTVVAKNGIDTRLTKNADELTAEDSAGAVITGVITEKAEDEIVTPINTTEPTTDKAKASTEESNIQKKITETGKGTQNKKAPEEKKAVAENVAMPSPAPVVENDIIKPQQTEETVAEASATAKEVQEEELTTQSFEPAVSEKSDTTQAMLTDAADEEKPEPTEILQIETSAEEKAPASGGGGGGSSSSAYAVRRMTVLELKVDIENIEKAIDAASKFVPMQNGVYTMSAEEVKKLLSELEKEGISASFPEGIEDEEISFTITAK